MRKISVYNAVGETLCHDMTAILDSGFKGVKFRRGHKITEADIPEMLDIGKTQIFVWEPGKDEVHEDDAAKALTEVLCGENLVYSGPSEGKFQISASVNGLFCVNSEALKHINSVGDYTVAARRGYTPVTRGETLAGARIVPLVTRQEIVDKAVSLAREGYPVLSVKPYVLKKAGAIITGSEIFNGRIKDAFEPVLSKKLSQFERTLSRVTICDDNLDMIKGTIASYIDEGLELILLTGGMSVDPDDLTPTAIRESGADIIARGVPMQPGNMLTIAYLGDTALLGVPGASMHSPITSLDVFLPRIMAKERISAADIAALGEGGFNIGF